MKNNCNLCFTIYKGIDYSLRAAGKQPLNNQNMTTTAPKITILRKGSSLRIILLDGVQIGQVVANWKGRQLEITVNGHFFTFYSLQKIQDENWITSRAKNILGIQ